MSDITFNVDVSKEETIAPEMRELGWAMEVLHEKTNLRIEEIEMNSNDGYPLNFRMEGAILKN